MLRVALRSVAARFGRLVLTSIAIVASTAFLSGTFILRDTVNRTLDALFAAVYENVDVYVQSSSSIRTPLGFERRDDIRHELVAEIAALPGVADAQAYIDDDAVIIGKDGAPIQGPTRSTNGATINTGDLTLWTVVAGRAPEPNEVVIDAETAREGGFEIGDAVKINTDRGSRTLTLTGIAQYADIATPGNATWALFDEVTAMEMLTQPGYVEAVLVRGDGSVGDQELAARVGRLLAERTDLGRNEALTGAEATAQFQTEIDEGLGFLTIFLSIFSFIALGVGCFVIYNLFSISAAQRTRENALLRAVGASKRQITAMVLGEATAVGIVGSLLGLAGGIGLAVAVRSVLHALDLGLPARGLALEPGTMAITVAAGLVTTLVAGTVPAIAAGRVPPVAAMAEASFEHARRMRARSVVAAISFALGITAIHAVMNGAAALLLGGAVVALFTGVILIGPAMANPIARALGTPVERVRGITGSMARGNVQRNPRRTARTAAPVLIGVALVTGASVFAVSIKAQIRETISQRFKGEYVVNSTNGGAVSFSQDLVDQLNALPEVGMATGPGFVPLRSPDGERAGFGTAVDPATAADLVDYEFVVGSLAALTPEGILVSSGEAEREGWQIGSIVPTVIGVRTADLVVQGIFRSGDFVPSQVVHRDALSGTGTAATAPVIILTRAGGVSDGALRAAVDAAIAAYGIGELQSRDQFIAGRGEFVDQTLAFIYGLLSLSIVIAVFGIVLTMLLAVYERRRETGLLRAVGMTRAQVRTTVRWESVLTSLYGAVVGVTLGLVLGYVVIIALRDEGLTTYSVPVTAIAGIVVIAFVVGVLAAVLPARRATRMSILDAIAADG